MTNGNDSINSFKVTDYEGDYITTGLSKREYFAAMALQGYIAAGANGMPEAKQLATYAREAADVLIEALNANNQQ